MPISVTMWREEIDTIKTPVALVLVVDDDWGMRQILRQLLESENLQVIEASNGQEAVELCDRYSPNLILLDAVMPIMDGFTCCRQLCEIYKSCPVPILMVTTLDDEASMIRAFEAGAIDYVTKPINQPVLRQRVQRLIQQFRLMQQVQRMNVDLEQYAQTLNVAISEQTAELQRSLEFESTLKHITDRVRDSLDKDTILQTVVRELASALELGCCNAAIYDSEQRVSYVRYEYTTSITGYENQTIQMENYPEIYQQLLQGEPVQFCSLSTSAWRDRVALFAFPIKNGEVLGDIWLVSSVDRILDDLEVRLVKQVTNQCAIGIRQAHLYEVAQAQVQELEHLNQLKDDFLSTVSHELRTPVTNIRVAIQLLKQLIQSSQALSQETPELSANLNRSSAYLQILHSECDREISLINDLLDLQRLESQQQTCNPVTLDLQNWLSQEIAAFAMQTKARQQTFQMNLANPLPAIQLDPSHLRRILTELIHNACKYSPDEATITLDATITGTDASIVCISIINTGATIPEPELERIFEKFYRIPKSDRWKQGGTGLGLALVKRLVEQCGGSIRATSTVTQTCFTIELPII